MKLVALIFLISGTIQAKTYEVIHRGHSYIFENDSNLKIKSSRYDLHLAPEACGKMLRKSLVTSFETSLKHQVINPKNTSGLIQIKSDSTSLFVPETHKNGRLLQLFPEEFAKAVLIQRELCKKKK